MKAPEVESFHKRIVASLRPHAHTQIEICNRVSLSDNQVGSNWKRINSGVRSKLYFAARVEPAKSKPTVARSELFFELEKGGADPKLWWQWQEEWTVPSREAFELIGVSIAFEWGDRHSGFQVLRADWDNTAHRGDQAGQPHWQIGSGLFVRSVQSSRPFGVDKKPFAEIESLPKVGQGETYEQIALGPVRTETYEAIAQISGIEMSGAHLFMGGWTQDKVTPTCWQHRTSNLPDVAFWAARTLEYVRTQTSHFKGRVAV